MPTAYRIMSAMATAGRHHRAGVAALTPPSSPSIGIGPGPFACPYPSSLVPMTVPITSVDSGLGLSGYTQLVKPCIRPDILESVGVVSPDKGQYLLQPWPYNSLTQSSG